MIVLRIDEPVRVIKILPGSRGLPGCSVKGAGTHRSGCGRWSGPIAARATRDWALRVARSLPAEIAGVLPGGCARSGRWPGPLPRCRRSPSTRSPADGAVPARQGPPCPPPRVGEHAAPGAPFGYRYVRKSKCAGPLTRSPGTSRCWSLRCSAARRQVCGPGLDRGVISYTCRARSLPEAS